MAKLFGGGIWNIAGIVSNGAVFAHINYKSDKKMLTHSTAFPNKLFNRWRWEKDVADQILYMDRDMWDSDDQMVVYNYLRELLERSGLLEEKFDKFIKNHTTANFVLVFPDEIQAKVSV